MKKGTPAINWSDELATAVRVLGKAILRFLGWMLSILMTVGLIGVITGVIVGGAFLLYVQNYLDTGVDDFSMMAEDRQMTTSIAYLDEKGNIVEDETQRLSALENRVWVKYSDMGDYLPNAFVAIEDKRFYEHDGVDWIRTIKVTLDFFVGSGSQGGSTITQQLIKNITGEDDVTIQRKAQEIFRALNLEKKYDKTEILEMYLNNIYLSQSCYGVGAAAYTYFSKDVKDLTLIEAAAIAAITQNPSRWDPIIYPENNAIRRNEVLLQMYDQGWITQEEFSAAYNQELVLNVPGEDENSGITIHSWYTDAAQQEAVQLLVEEFGYTSAVAEKLLLTSGLTIVTAQDPKAQAILEKYYEDDYWWDRYDESPIQPNSSAVIIDPNNGNVVALVGSRGQKNINLGLNYATQTKRPAGSSIKPLSVYAPGLQSGAFTYGSVFDDVPINFGQEVRDPETGELLYYSNSHGYPRNNPDSYQGLTTVHEGIRVSKNTIAWRALETVGLQNSFDFLTEDLGFTTLVDRYVSSNGSVYSDIAYAPLSMGEFTYGVTVKEMTAAYQIFANGGIYNSPRIVLKILDANGEVLVDNQKESKIVLSAQNASIMTKMLQDVVLTGTASAITLKHFVDCAGKTGTTQAGRDRWFIGYTPYYVCGVWFGYSIPRTLSNFGAVPVKMWNYIMWELSQEAIDKSQSGEEPLKTFELAPGVVTATYCKDSGKLMTDACRADPRGSRAEMGYFVSGTEPVEYCDTHILVPYDTSTNAIAHPGCDSEDITMFGLLNIYRQLPYNIDIADSVYTGQILPPNYSYEGIESIWPYYMNLLPDGFYPGKQKNTYWRFNVLCSHPLKSEEESTSSETTSTPNEETGDPPDENRQDPLPDNGDPSIDAPSD